MHDTATGYDFIKSNIAAVHLFPYKLRPDSLVALFGEDVEARNGLLLQKDVGSALDDGAIAIIPDLLGDASSEDVALWEENDPKDYRWEVIDDEAESLDTTIILKSQGAPKDITIRDLDGQMLSFKNDHRPIPRYLCFLYVVAQLKMAWRHEYRQDPARKPKPQLVVKGFWATRGRYPNRALLLALAEEIGHDTSFPKNIPPLPDNDAHPESDVGDG